MDQSQSKQINTLLYCMGESVEDVLAFMHPTKDEKGYYGVVMDNFFKVRKNVIFEWARLNNRVQLPKETAEQFITDLSKVAITLKDLRRKLLEIDWW